MRVILIIILMSSIAWCDELEDIMGQDWALRTSMFKIEQLTRKTNKDFEKAQKKYNKRIEEITKRKIIILKLSALRFAKKGDLKRVNILLAEINTLRAHIKNPIVKNHTKHGFFMKIGGKTYYWKNTDVLICPQLSGLMPISRFPINMLKMEPYNETIKWYYNNKLIVKTRLNRNIEFGSESRIIKVKNINECVKIIDQFQNFIEGYYQECWPRFIQCN